MAGRLAGGRERNQRSRVRPAAEHCPQQSSRPNASRTPTISHPQSAGHTSTRASRKLDLSDLVGASGSSADESISAQSDSSQYSRTHRGHQGPWAAALDKERSTSLPNRKVPLTVTPGLESLSDDCHYSPHWGKPGRQLHETNTLMAWNLQKERKAQESWHSSGQLTLSSPEDWFEALRGQEDQATAVTQSCPDAEEIAAASQKMATMPATPSLAASSAHRHEAIYRLSRAASRFSSSEASGGSSSKSDQTDMEEGHMQPGAGVLDRMQESSRGSESMASGETGRGPLRRRTFNLTEALGLMDDSSSTMSARPGSSSSILQGFMDNCEAVEESEGSSTAPEKEEGRPLMVSRLPISEGMFPPTRRRLDTRASIDSLRRAAAGLEDTPRDPGSSRNEEDESSLATPPFCTPSPSPFKDIRAAPPAGAGTGLLGGWSPLTTAPITSRGPLSARTYQRLAQRKEAAAEPEAGASVIGKGVPKLTLRSGSRRASLDSGVMSLTSMADAEQHAGGAQGTHQITSAQTSTKSVTFDFQTTPMGKSEATERDSRRSTALQTDGSLSSLSATVHGVEPMQLDVSPGMNVTVPPGSSSIKTAPSTTGHNSRGQNSPRSVPQPAESLSPRADAMKRRSLLKRLRYRALQAVQSLSPKAHKNSHASPQGPRHFERQSNRQPSQELQATHLTPRAAYTVTVEGWPSSETSPSSVVAPPGAANISPPQAPPPITSRDLPATVQTAPSLSTPETPPASKPSRPDGSLLSPRGLQSIRSDSMIPRPSVVPVPPLSHLRRIPLGQVFADTNLSESFPATSSRSTSMTSSTWQAPSRRSVDSPRNPGRVSPFQPDKELSPIHSADTAPTSDESPTQGKSSDKALEQPEAGGPVDRHSPTTICRKDSSVVTKDADRSAAPASQAVTGGTKLPGTRGEVTSEIQPDADPSPVSLGPETPEMQPEASGRQWEASRAPQSPVAGSRPLTLPIGFKALSDSEGGLGVIIMEDSGNRYEGQVGLSGIHGLGVLHFQDGGSFAGQWDCSAYHGAGIETYASGSHYVGEFGEGTYHGCGSCHYAEGTTYVGQWRAGLQHGLGCQSADGGVAFWYVGSYESGQRCGLGVAGYGNGEEFLGELAGDSPNGYGVAYLGDRKGTYEGQWLNGVRHGWAVTTLSNKSMWAGQWIMGKACWLGELRLPTNGELADQYVEAMDLCEEAARLARAAGEAALAQAHSVHLPGSKIQVAIHEATKKACGAARDAHLHRQKAQQLCVSSPRESA